MIKDQKACCIPWKWVKSELHLRTSWPFWKSKDGRKTWAPRLKMTIKRLSVKITKIQLMSQVSSAAGKSGRFQGLQCLHWPYGIVRGRDQEWRGLTPPGCTNKGKRKAISRTQGLIIYTTHSLLMEKFTWNHEPQTGKVRHWGTDTGLHGGPCTQHLRAVGRAPHLTELATPTILQEEEGGAIHFSNGVWMKLESKQLCNESLLFIMGITL